MSERDTTPTQQDPPVGRGNDDRRHEVKPNDNPAPSSPEPETDSVREGHEKLERVKPY